MKETKCAISELLTVLRKEVEIEDVKVVAGKFKAPTQSNNILSPQHSDELRYLNMHWGDWDEIVPFTSHRPFIGRILSKFKTKFQSYLYTVIFKDYIARQKSFNMNLVKQLNQMSRYVDERDKQIFWETVHKLDNEASLIEERYDTLFSEIIERIDSRN